MDEADVKFIQDMIVHHQAAIDMANKYLSSTSPTTRQARVADWAREIATGQAAEIKRVTGWLKSAGATTKSSSGGMSGM